MAPPSVGLFQPGAGIVVNLLTLAVLGGHHGHSHGGHDHGHGSHSHGGHEHGHDEGAPTSANTLLTLLAAHAIISISLLHLCTALSSCSLHSWVWGCLAPSGCEGRISRSAHSWNPAASLSAIGAPCTCKAATQHCCVSCSLQSVLRQTRSSQNAPCACRHTQARPQRGRHAPCRPGHACRG